MGKITEVGFLGNEPKYMSEGAAGADLSAKKMYTIQPNTQVMVDTGTKVALPKNTVGFLTPRSSLCNKNGLRLVNSVGILDEDYRGNIKFCYRNEGSEVIVIGEGERIGQMVVVPYIKAVFTSVETLDITTRGVGGFGSTGG